jgi:hypothetical protein
MNGELKVETQVESKIEVGSAYLYITTDYIQ